MVDPIASYRGPLITRAEAKALSLRRYFTGKPCGPKDHISQRYTGDGRCIACIAAPPRPAPAQITVHYEGPIISRAEARKLGLRHYFTGKPCKHGHIAQRFVSRWICVECNRLYQGYLWTARYDEMIAADRRRDKKKRNASSQKRRDANPEKYRAMVRRRKARRRANGGTFTPEDELKLRSRQKKCHICRKRFTKGEPATIDHVIPLSKEGRDDASNIALAHYSCNSKKQNRITHLL